MRKFERFLFFYSILVITILFVSFGIFSPKPLNIISIISLLPIIFYFWVRLTSPQVVSADKWSLRFLMIATIVSFLGIYAFNLVKQTPLINEQLAQEQKRNEELKKEIKELKNKPTATPEPTVEEEDVTNILYD
ncbi:MAG: hypothetical protein UV64_C0035G0007 [Parcubacteria group bacterium GW2011_GWC1_43_11b]|nr:MAG: hypothetical protein UV64_C0035G0007 [Parcubacteria group bacterium GW2011_GWC1_43_11b]